MFKRTLLKAEASGWNPATILHSGWDWRKTRKGFIKLQPCCQMCGSVKKLQVHHVFPWHLFEDLRYEYDNLITLDRDCHFKFGHQNNWKLYNPGIVELVRVSQQFSTTDINWGSFERSPDFVTKVMNQLPETTNLSHISRF